MTVSGNSFPSNFHVFFPLISGSKKFLSDILCCYLGRFSSPKPTDWLPKRGWFAPFLFSSVLFCSIEIDSFTKGGDKTLTQPKYVHIG